MESHNIRLCKCPPPHTSIRPLGGQIHVLVQNNLVRSFRALQHDLTLYFPRDRRLSVSSIPRKARVIHCHALCFARLRACAPVFFFFSPPDNLFKARDRAISGKEMPLRSKQWVTSLSLPQPSTACFFPLCMQICTYLLCYSTREGTAENCDICFKFLVFLSRPFL